LPPLAGYSEPATPPEGGLILKSYTRGLLRDEKGELKRPRRYLMAGGGYGWPAEPQCDHVWLTAAEWQALVPADPKEGDGHPVPQWFVDRIATFHLLDKALGTPGFFWSKTSGKMSLKVGRVNDLVIEMRLSGQVKVGEKDGGYPVKFDGFIRYNREKKAFTRFDMLALGAPGGEQRTAKVRDSSLNISYEVPRGCQPLLAVFFDLVSGEQTIDRVPPYPIMYGSERSYNRPYFQK
jgi:hypothetical protein